MFNVYNHITDREERKEEVTKKNKMFVKILWENIVCWILDTVDFQNNRFYWTTKIYERVNTN